MKLRALLSASVVAVLALSPVYSAQQNLITPNPKEELPAAFDRAAAVARKQSIADVILHIISMM